MNKHLTYYNELKTIFENIRPLFMQGFGKCLYHDKTGPQDLVTEFDVDIEKCLKIELGRKYPYIDFVGEETGGSRDKEQFWLVDPIDGTSSYIRRLPWCTSMLALVDRGEVICSVIYAFVQDKFYYAEKGKGAFLNGRRIRVSENPLSSSCMFWETRGVDQNRVNNIHINLINKSRLLSTLTSGFEYALVAEGKADGRIALSSQCMDYDSAPGALLVKEAGGVVANLGSGKFDYRDNNIIAVNPNIYSEIKKEFDKL